ncbi:MAG: DUF448 domain-containing protein [Proteobacteria bacterium]|nr:DUF448 domain-containing protein [Pseudomonadota bacterium]
MVMQRTCISCGMKRPKQELCRFVWRDEMPMQDFQQSESGRGAYCCEGERCHQAFFKERKKWKRVFRL